MALKTENPNNARKALIAFYSQKRIELKTSPFLYRAVFEHGQLWIVSNSGAQWSVVDAEGGTSVNGFDFEQVAEAGEN